MTCEMSLRCTDKTSQGSDPAESAVIVRLHPVSISAGKGSARALTMMLRLLPPGI